VHAKIGGCNTHIERYLKLSAIDYQVPEAKQMLKLFAQLYLDKQNDKIENIDSVKNKYIQICDSYLDKYEKLNEIDKKYFRDSYLVFRRLKQKLHQHLAFVTHANVPYSNNLIERDFRHAKTKMKVSGTFRG
jgi:hypothetical protein